MKTVGVITMHRVVNYGSVLQTYATQYTIEKLGYRCEIIDYLYPNEFQYKKGHKNTTINWKNKIAKLLGLKAYWRKVKKFEDFYSSYLNLSRPYNSYNEIHQNPPLYDIYLTGSDQTWNPIHTKGDDTFLLGFAPKGKNKISFSASFANKDIPNEFRELYRKFLSQYNYITVRENNGKDIIKGLLNKEVNVTLDPTLLLSKTEWSKLIKSSKKLYKKEPYILLYSLTYAFDPAPYIYMLIKEIQEKTGFTIYSFTDIPLKFKGKHFHLVNEVSPTEFIQIFSNASFVVTSSFHGTAFAVNFGIPLLSVVNNVSQYDDRQSDLLNKLNLKNCILKKDTPLENLDFNNCKTKACQQELNKLRQNSIDLLKFALSL